MKKPTPTNIFLLLVIGLLVYSNWHATRNAKSIPLSPNSVVVPHGCEARAWGNALEIDCPKGATVIYSQPLKAPSPR